MLSLAASCAGGGCLEKLKRGFEGTGRVVVSFVGVGRKERLSGAATATLEMLVFLHTFTRQLLLGKVWSHSPAFPPWLAYVPYLCLEKSWGRSRGPSGTLALPRPAWLWFGVGSGRAAVMALDALVLRRRLPWSPVFWNLRTRSSDEAGLAPFDTTSHYATAPICFFVPEEPLESSDMLDPDRSGTLVDSMVRVVVRGCVAMVHRCQLHS